MRRLSLNLRIHQLLLLGLETSRYKLSVYILARQLRLLTVLLLPQDSNRDKIQTNEQSSGLCKLFKEVSQHLSSGLNSKIALISKPRVKMEMNWYELFGRRA